MFVPRKYTSKKFWSNKFWIQNIFGTKTIFNPIIFGFNICLNIVLKIVLNIGFIIWVQYRAFSQPKLRSGQALFSKIGTILRLNKDNTGHISQSLPNLSQLSSFQNMKISKVRTKLGQIGAELGKNTSLAAKGALANRLQRRTACRIQNGRQGAPKWQRGSGKVSTPRFLGVPVNFR